MVLAGVLTAGVASASLYDYYQALGQNLPSVKARTSQATSCGIQDYVGSKAQNLILEACLQGEQSLGATPTPTSSAARKYVEAPDFFLYSPAVVNDTTITLNDLNDIYGNTLTMSNDFGTMGYGRIDPDSSNSSESFSFTGITANSDGTYTLTGVKTVMAKYPYTQTSGLDRSHSINAIVRFTNTAAFYDDFANKENDEIVDGNWSFTSLSNTTFTTHPSLSSDTDTANAAELVTFGQLSRQAISGAADGSETVKGIYELSTGAEAAAASSTGSTGARLVLPASLASSTSSGSYTVPVTNASGTLDSSFGGSASGLATLDANSLVVENPANATSTPTANKIVMASSTGKINLDWIPTSTIYATATDTLQNSADTERTKSNQDSYTLVKQLQVLIGGTIRVKYQAYSNSPGTIKLSINGLTYSETAADSGSYSTVFSTDFQVGAGSVVQAYYKTFNNSSTNIFIKNFRIYYDENVTSTHNIVITD